MSCWLDRIRRTTFSPWRRRERRRPQVDAFAAVELDGNLAVLGKALVRDIHLREYLHPRYHVGRDGEGDRLYVDECAVDTKTHVHHVVFRLEMNVARALGDGQAYQLVDQDDGIAGNGLEPSGGDRRHACQRITISRFERTQFACGSSLRVKRSVSLSFRRFRRRRRSDRCRSRGTLRSSAFERSRRAGRGK